MGVHHAIATGFKITATLGAGSTTGPAGPVRAAVPTGPATGVAVAVAVALAFAVHCIFGILENVGRHRFHVKFPGFARHFGCGGRGVVAAAGALAPTPAIGGWADFRGVRL